MIGASMSDLPVLILAKQSHIPPACTTYGQTKPCLIQPALVQEAVEACLLDWNM